MFIPTADDKRRYNENRRKKYSESSEHRAVVSANNKKYRNENGSKLRSAQRAKWSSDPEYREKRLAPRRGRCQRNDMLKASYGITLNDYNKMAKEQGFACAICREPATENLSVDHCHATQKVRGLLCRKCNAGLGCYRDRPDLMISAISYLEKNSVL